MDTLVLVSVDSPVAPDDRIVHLPFKNPPLPQEPLRVDISRAHKTTIVLDPRRVKPMPDNPRLKNNPGFSPESIAALAESIKVTGQIEPVLVCATDDPRYDAELVDGERRMRSCLMGEMLIEARVDLSITDRERHFLYAITANFHRPGHTCIEIAYAISRLKEKHTQKEIAQIFGKSVGWVEQHVSLLRLDPTLHEYLVEDTSEGEAVSGATPPSVPRKRSAGKLSFQLALLVSGIPVEHQKVVTEKIIRDRMTFDVARRFLLRYIDEHEIDTRRRQRPPSETLVALEGFVRRSGMKIGVYCDKRPAELRALFDTQPAADRVQLAREMEVLAQSIKSIAEILDPRPKSART